MYYVLTDSQLQQLTFLSEEELVSWLRKRFFYTENTLFDEVLDDDLINETRVWNEQQDMLVGLKSPKPFLFLEEKWYVYQVQDTIFINQEDRYVELELSEKDFYQRVSEENEDDEDEDEDGVLSTQVASWRNQEVTKLSSDIGDLYVVDQYSR